MLLSLVHSIRFDFENPVFLDPIWLRMRPRTDLSQTLLSFRMESLPDPGRIEPVTDLDGNSLSRLWYGGDHRTLILKTTSLVRTLRSNPFDFLFHHPRGSTLPMAYPPRTLPLISPYLKPEPSSEKGPLFRKFVNHLQEVSLMETIPFLVALARHIRESLSNQFREEGPPRSPEETLKEGSGSCRDFALLAMEACRAMNIAARFTSGYHLPSSPIPHSLHAWAEAYLPEIGWRGIDPSEGLLTADRHVALVSSADPFLTLPTEGTFRGPGSSTLNAFVRIEPLPDPEGIPAPQSNLNDGPTREYPGTPLSGASGQSSGPPL